MIVKSLKAVTSALKEALKDTKMSDVSRKKLEESDAALQTLLREAEKSQEAYMAKKEEEESAESDEKSMKDHENVKPGHKVTKTTVIKHDGPVDGDGEEDEEEESKKGEEESSKEDDKGDEKDDDEKDSEESKKVAIASMLKEAGIPEKLWGLEKLSKLSFKEAKEVIEEKKTIFTEARKAAEENMEVIPMSMGEPLKESDGGENLNSLFSGCAQ